MDINSQISDDTFIEQKCERCNEYKMCKMKISKNTKRQYRYPCEHISSKYKCIICNPKVKCGHGRCKYNCAECNGLSCRHYSNKSKCRICISPIPLKRYKCSNCKFRKIVNLET